MISIVDTNDLSIQNNLLKNTFMLLAATFAFSAITALISIILAVPFIGPWWTLGVYIAILFALHYNANNGLGVLLCFALTGWLGFTTGPILSTILAIKPGIVISAFALATTMFAGLSAYAIISKRDFTYMGSFLTIGTLVAFAAGLISMIFSLPMLGLLVSAAFVILSSGLILWQVSNIINGGETNYVLATVTLFVSFYNIFMGLINLFSATND